MNNESHKCGPTGWLPAAWLLLTLLAGVLAWPCTASAQPGQGGLSVEAAGGTGEVKIELEAFGLGKLARRGDWTGVRIRINDSASKQRELILRIAGLDADGDTPLYQREVTTNPGVWQSVWMYVHLPFGYDSNDGMAVSAYEASEVTGAKPEDAVSGYRPGRMVGYTQMRTPGGASGSVRDASAGMMAMVGSRALGLRQYSQNSGQSWHPQGHEITDVALGITPADMPDRWVGLAPFEVIVWSQGEPSELRGDRAKALREWVERGGHLVIVLPGVGQTWTNKDSNDLHDIMPVVAVGRKESADLSAYRDLLIRRPTKPDEPERPFPKTGVIHTFRPQEDAQPSDAMRILNTPDGDCVVVRRLVGAGAVTLIGIDLNQTAFSQFELIDADVFWHRVLGRRGNLAPIDTKQPQQGFGSRRIWFFDQDIQAEIAKQGRAAAGVLVGFVVFVLYWLIAGPLGFTLLRQKKISQHAWLGFVLVSGLFTAVSWTGATLLRPSKVEATHLTFLDHVYGQPLQRARMWTSLLIPWYGDARISIAQPDTDAAHRTINTITSWDSPTADAASWGGFPDVRGYLVDTRDPASMRVPTRSTVKQLQVDWAGGPVWEMPRPARVEEGGTGKLTLTKDVNVSGENRPSLLEGTLMHKLPGTLQDVLILVVRRQTNVGSVGNALICVADAFKPKLDWAPGDPLDLKPITMLGSNALVAGSYLASFTPQGELIPNTSRGSENSSRDTKNLTALAFFSQLEPPIPGGTDPASVYAAHRAATHGWDLGVWFTHPCVIVVGHLLAGPSPVPLLVDGKPVPTTGRTVVRWVYPLPDDPPRYRDAPEPVAPKVGGSAGPGVESGNK